MPSSSNLSRQIAKLLADATVIELAQLAKNLQFSRDIDDIARFIEQHNVPSLRVMMQPVWSWEDQPELSYQLTGETEPTPRKATTIGAVKVIREVLGLGLAEAKKIVDVAAAATGPGYKDSKQAVLWSGDDAEEAQAVVEKFSARGLAVTLA